ncbi:hypothetical protein [Candidatus Finniella inopinata]|uniref:Uncharacterized protein n=1 Tax=Candidatus Finniella inopinata TaxID=1696036 RepID=A0A4Q7DHC6_9PROT|nr:hypothetical protein [Candidatus Finniella inopinata]RZI46112.1 hypothetical protein EQU50_04040 [Candidatus Finniella inopinata]
MKASVEQLDDDIADLKARLSKVIQSAKIIASCPFEPYPVRLKRENQIYGHLFTLESPDA